MSKFKVGDRVAVVGTCTGKTFSGETGTIKNVSFHGKLCIGVEFDKDIGGHGGGLYFHGKKDHCWFVREGMLKPVSGSKTIVIYANGTTTTALLKDGKKVLKTAIAKCSPTDTYDFKTGALIAFDRLCTEISKFPPKEDKPVQPLNIVKQDSYEVGDRVKIIDWWDIGCCQNFGGEMDKWLGKVMTVKFDTMYGAYRMLEDGMENSGRGWTWKTEAIEGKVMEPVREVKRPAKVGEYIKVVNTDSDEKAYKNGDICEVIGDAVAAMGDAAGGLYAKTRGTHPCNIGKNTSYLYQSEYVVLEGYKGGAKNED